MKRRPALILLACAASLVPVVAAIVLPAAATSSSACDSCLPQDATATKGDWCLSQQRYVALGEFATGPDGLCPLNGPPDDPAVRDAAVPTPETPIKTVRLAFHVFRDNNGANAVASEADVIHGVNALNEKFAPWRIQFVYQWRYVNNSKYRLCEPNEEYQMKRSYADSPTTKLNIYVVDTGGGSHGTFPWMSTALTAQGGIVQHHAGLKGINYPTVLPHEVGHCLGLWHVFHGVSEVAQCGDCYEPAGRTAEVGDTTGDFCSDTGSTPRNDTCNEPGTIDPCTNIQWTDTPIGNIMGYGLFCANTFSPHQAGRMHAWTEHVLTGWLVVPGPPASPGTPTVSKIGAGTARVSWADNSSDEDGFRVQRETKSGSIWINPTIVGTAGPNGTTITDAAGVGTFRYRVQGWNGYGDSAWSGWTQIKL